MNRRSKTQWAQLIEDQNLCGMSATKFCRRKEIKPKYSSHQKLLSRDNSFVRAIPDASAVKFGRGSIKPGIIELEGTIESLRESLAALIITLHELV
ncbi:MAG: hypothetical protein JKX81_11225 [Arenicella sp.]|nr:hypothetical protein [Arenicella sp.]